MQVFLVPIHPGPQTKQRLRRLKKWPPLKEHRNMKHHETPIQNVHPSYFELVLAILSFVFIELQHCMDDFSTTGTTGPSFLASFRSLPKMRALSLGSDGVFGSGCFGWWIYMDLYSKIHPYPWDYWKTVERNQPKTKGSLLGLDFLHILFVCFAWGFHNGLFAVFCWGFFVFPIMSFFKADATYVCIAYIIVGMCFHQCVCVLCG